MMVIPHAAHGLEYGYLVELGIAWMGEQLKYRGSRGAY